MGEKTRNIRIDKSDLRLRFTTNEIVHDNFNPAGVEFDNQYNSQHAIEPNFDYYETHEFHTLKDKDKISVAN